MKTKSVTLIHGYHDPESGDIWKDVTVRCPVFDDEIRAQEACGQSTATSLYTLYFIIQCITSFGPLVKAPEARVLRRMHRDDVTIIHAAISDLEMGLPGNDESPGSEETPDPGSEE